MVERVNTCMKFFQIYLICNKVSLLDTLNFFLPTYINKIITKLHIYMIYMYMYIYNILFKIKSNINNVTNNIMFEIGLEPTTFSFSG